MDNDDDNFDCDDCGDRTSNDDGYWVGRQEDTQVCDDCRSNHYQYAYGRRGAQYYVHEDNVVYVESNSEHYDQDYLGDNNIVELNNGDYEELENAVEVDGDWYHIDDERICRTEDTDEFMRVDDGCWQCAESGNWYTDDCENFTEYEGQRYHDDYIPKHIADATADKDDAEDEADTTAEDKPEPTMLTMDMLSEVSLVEDYSIEHDIIRFSMTILHDGTKLFGHRDVPRNHIATHGMDRVRTDMRKMISTELMHMAYINANAYLESTTESN
jgi:hypothetical protein